MLFEPFGLEYRKDALRAIWLGVSKGCSWSLMAWSIERMLLEPYGLEYGMDNFFWRNIYLSVPLLTQYPPCLPQEERYSIGLLRVRLAPFCRSAWRSAWHPPTQTPLHSPPPQQVGQSPPPAARPRWCPPQGRRTAGEAAGWDDCPASAAGAGAGGGGGGGAGGDALGDGGRHRGGGSGGGGGEIQMSNFRLINANLFLTLSSVFTGS
jgi:uncharacterized membrane protein YgcG